MKEYEKRLNNPTLSDQETAKAWKRKRRAIYPCVAAGLVLLVAGFLLREHDAGLPLMVAGAVVSVTCSVAGLFIGTVIDVPCSAIIVLLLCAAYLASRIAHTAVIRTRSRRYLPTE